MGKDSWVYANPLDDPREMIAGICRAGGEREEETNVIKTVVLSLKGTTGLHPAPQARGEPGALGGLQSNVMRGIYAVSDSDQARRRRPALPHNSKSVSTRT